MKKIDLTNKKLGKWLVIKYLEDRYWLCKCDCGTMRAVNGYSLRRDASKSCGCNTSKGENNPMYGRTGINSPHFGKKRPEHSERMGGENHPNWNDNLTNDERIIKRNYPEYKEWSKQVKIRDNFTCVKCGKIGGNLHSHHIEDYSNNIELRTELSNGTTLCKGCHKDFHHIFGKSVNTKKQLERFISE